MDNSHHSSIIDNSDGNKLIQALTRMGEAGDELWIATAFFSLDALEISIAEDLPGVSED